MDAGEILGQSQIEITNDTNAQQLHDKLSLLAVDLLMDVMRQIENGTAKYQHQDESQVSFAGKFSKADGYIDWNLNSEQIRNKIRGMWSWPGAQSYFISGATGKSFRVIIAEAELAQPVGNSQWKAAGVLNENLDVVCGQGCLKIIKIKPSGSGLMDFKSFVNGRAVKPGDILTSIEPTE
jgi:methionyl-tRNA formyltransferase